MITLHCLAYSRAIRLVWLLEEIGAPYKLCEYQRTKDFHAPDALKEVHMLGKSPVIEDEGLKIAESATCLRYLAAKFGGDAFQPEAGTQAYFQHEELLDYVESSFAQAAMGVLLPKLQGDAPARAAVETLRTHFGYLAQRLPANGLLFGPSVTLADIQFSYLLANLSAASLLADQPLVAAYWTRLQQQQGYRKATAKAGPMAPDM